MAELVLLSISFFARRDDFCGAGPVAWGRPPGRPARTQEEPDLGVRRGRGRPPHVLVAACRYAGQDCILQAGFSTGLFLLCRPFEERR